MTTSFFIVKPVAFQQVAETEHSTLKEAEKDLRAGQPGDYWIVQVVRQAHVDEVPTRIRVQMTSTRTRAPRDPNVPRKPRKPRAPKPS